MDYIDREYYIAAYGENVPEDLDRLITEASGIIDTIADYRITDISAMPAVIAERIRRAVAEEVFYLDQNGGTAALACDDMSQMTLGRFSYSDYSQSGKKSGGIPVSPRAYSLLESVGLNRRG